MASHSTDEIPLSESESDSEPENKGMKSGGSGNEKQSGDDETPEDKDEDNSKTGEEEETEASVYTEQDLTEESKYLGGTFRCLTLYISPLYIIYVYIVIFSSSVIKQTSLLRQLVRNILITLSHVPLVNGKACAIVMVSCDFNLHLIA